MPSQDDVDFYKTHLFHFQQDIGTELDLLYDYGKLFVRHIEEHPHFSANVQNSFGTVGGRRQSHEPSLGEVGVVGDVNDGDLESEYDDMEEDESIPFKRTVDCISDCLCDFFQDSAFDIQSIVALSELFFESEQFSSQTPHSIDTIKTKVITRLVIKIFVAAALSKSQMDTMNKLIKAILAFASPKNEEIARGVHASYLSCRRGTKKHHREMDLY